MSPPAVLAELKAAPVSTEAGSQLWFAAAELIGQPGLPTSRRRLLDFAKRHHWSARPREGRGGGQEFHFADLPAETKVALRLAERRRANAASPAPVAAPPADPTHAWAEFERKPEGVRKEAHRRFEALHTATDLIASGTSKMAAYEAVAKQLGDSVATIRGWFGLVKGADQGEWLPLLAPKWAGRVVTRDYDARIYHWFRDQYLDASRPPATTVYRRVERIAAQHGLEMPPLRTLERHFKEREHPEVVVLEREGEAAVRRLYPHQKRDRSVFRAMEAVNVDGHQLDIDVVWPDGERCRATLIGIQDLYSGKYVGWRICKSENAHDMGLTVLDMCDRHGIPELLYIDNTRAMASKRMTAGAHGRKRFKDMAGDPLGVLPQLGIEVHFVSVASGQSKPIERSFKDVCNEISRHPEFSGAYLGSNTQDKPHNYGTRVVPVADVIRRVEIELALMNARPKRRTDVCRGLLSFDEAFERSLAANPGAVRRISPAQRRLLYLYGDVRPVDREHGYIEAFGNIYWTPELARIRGTKVVVRYHPTERTLHDAIHVYRLSGEYIGEVPCYHRAGFNSAEDAKQHTRARRQHTRRAKDLAKAARQLAAAEVAKLADPVFPTETPAAPADDVLRPAFGIASSIEAPVPTVKKPNDAQQRVVATLSRASASFEEQVRNAARLAG